MAREKINPRHVRRFAKEYIYYLKKKHHLPVEQAYLFGSYSKGKQRKWSDIDVCIISKKFKRYDPLEYLWVRRRDIDIDRGIEPYGIHPDDFVDENPIAYEVKKHGISLQQ